MARVGVMIEENLRRDTEIVASVTGETMYGVLEKAVTEYFERLEPKIKTALETARKARK